MKTTLYAITGFILASVLAWGGLLAWAAISVAGDDSYWDRTPYAADLFFAVWLLSAIGAAVAGIRLSRRSTL